MQRADQLVQSGRQDDDVPRRLGPGGLRFQLDQVTPIEQLLGHPLDITVTVTDSDKDVGTGKRSVVLSQTFLM